MIQRLLAMIFELWSLWDSTNNPWLNEINLYQRRILVFGGMAVAFLLLSVYFAPTGEQVSGTAVIAAVIGGYLYLGALIGLAICSLLSSVNIVLLWRFCREHGVE